MKETEIKLTVLCVSRHLVFFMIILLALSSFNRELHKKTEYVHIYLYNFI